MKDAALEFSVAQVVTATANSQNVIDLTPVKSTAIGRDLGPGQQVFLVISVPQAAAAAGAATVNFELWTDTQVSMATQTKIYDSGAIAKTALTVGSVPVVIALPSRTLDYLRLTYTVGTGPLTTGAFDAYVTLDAPRFIAYPRNYIV